MFGLHWFLFYLAHGYIFLPYLKLNPRYFECHIGIFTFVLNCKLSFLVAPQILVQFFVLQIRSDQISRSVMSNSVPPWIAAHQASLSITNWSISHTCFRGKWEIWVEFKPASQSSHCISLDQNAYFCLGSWETLDSTLRFFRL